MNEANRFRHGRSRVNTCFRVQFWLVDGYSRVLSHVTQNNSVPRNRACASKWTLVFHNLSEEAT